MKAFSDMVVYWKLAIFKAVNGALIVALGAIVAGLSNMNWSQMDGQSKFLFVCGVLLSVLKAIDMLLDTTIGRLRSGADQPEKDLPKMEV